MYNVVYNTLYYYIT